MRTDDEEVTDEEAADGRRIWVGLLFVVIALALTYAYIYGVSHDLP